MYFHIKRKSFATKDFFNGSRTARSRKKLSGQAVNPPHTLSFPHHTGLPTADVLLEKKLESARSKNITYAGNGISVPRNNYSQQISCNSIPLGYSVSVMAFKNLYAKKRNANPNNTDWRNANGTDFQNNPL